MGTVKYTGSVASFHCPTSAEIRSLKVHFSPKQLGEGTPSPENVREIVGWDGVEVEQRGKNLFDASNPNIISPNCWVSSNSPNKIITSSVDRTVYIKCLPNTTYVISKTLGNVLGAGYTTELPVTGIQAYSYMLDYYAKQVTVTTGADAKYLAIWFYDASKIFDKTVQPEDIYKTLQVELGSTVTSYEPYRGSTTNYEFGVLGKNKFDKSQCVDGARIMKANGSNYTGDSADYYISPFIPVAPGATYTKNSPTADAYHRFATYTSNDVSSFVRVFDDSNTITIQPNEKYLRFCGEIAEKDTAQLELGSTATAYEPYDPNHTVYGGWVDLISGEVCEEYEKIVIDGSENWALNAWSNNGVYVNHRETDYESRVIPFREAAVSEMTSNMLAPISHTYYIRDDGTFTIQAGDYLPNYTYLLLYNSAWGQTVEEYKAALKALYDNGTPLEICAPLKTAYRQTYQLTPTQLQTFLGTNNVWSNADYVEVEYDLHETQDILARKQFIMASQPHVEEASGAIATFNTDMAAKLKECKVGFKPKQDLHGYSKPWVGGSGKNLFNENNMTYGLWTSGGGTVDNLASYGCMANDKIFITAGTALYLTIFGNKLYSKAMIFYNTDGTFNSRAYSTGTVQLTYTPAIDCYVTVELASGSSTSTSITEEYVKAAKVVLSVGSAATTYEPYENICPIEGWTELEVTRCGKNFSTAATGTEMVQKWPINSGSSRELLFSGMQPGQEFTLSASFTKASEASPNKRLYLKGSQKTNSTTNAIFRGPSADGPQDAVIHNWVDTDGTIRISHNNRGLTYNDDFIEYAASLQNIQLEVGDTATEFEPYNGETIPITFPASINLLDTVAKTANKTLYSTGEEISENGMTVTTFMKVNEGSEYTLTFTSTEGARTRRIYGYDSNKDPVQALASASWVNVDSVGTLQATIPSGIEYIRVCYKTADTNISLIGPESSVFYGGYVDLTTGEIWKTYDKIVLDGDNIQVNNGNYESNGNYGAGLVYVEPTGKSVKYKNGLPLNLWCENIPLYIGMNTIPEPPYVYAPLAGKLYFVVYVAKVADHPELSDKTARKNYVNEWLKQNPITLVYELETPTIVGTLSPSQLKSLRGINNVWSNSNGDVQVKFWKH